MRSLPVPVALLLASAPLPALAQDVWAGQYRLAEGPDTAGELQLDADGSFRFGMSAGALDAEAQGRWILFGNGIALRTEPRPVAPAFTLAQAEPVTDGALSIMVTWPGGEGIAGVDFKILLDGAEPLTGYTQDYGWQSQPGDVHRVVSIQLAEPIYGTVSPVFPISDNARNFTFVLTPNDMGIADFDNAPAERTADGLQLHWRGGVLRFVRREKD